MKTEGGVILNGALLCCLLATAGFVQAEDVEDAREALQQKESDVTEESNLEEVFQAAQKQYSLLPSGEMSMNFGASYSYFRDNRINIAIEQGQITNFQIENDAQHSFGASLSLDYGIWDNLTLNTNLPVSYKYDTEKDVSVAALGDVSIGLRYQPFPIKAGATNTTLYTTLSTATGNSPYKIDTRNQVSSGKGYYSLGGGVSMSKVIDPVVLFGSVGYTHAFDVSGVNQDRGSRTLTGVETGDSVNFSFGLAYALSYEVSLSASYQQSYSFQSFFNFKPELNDDGDLIKPRVGSSDATSSVVNMSLGLRTAANRVINFSFGFGLTEDSPDVLMGFNVPVDFAGFKPGA
ncbi:transporter [Alcanivorax sp. 1008]|uniref:transporter n=1 Tax=Alcanivorax sp. 1008 TaxID=2816853 RepID=UPI001DF042A5|nr:transporter [Alcanivorax sp. 1008]MCC1498255.1 transporter [Alcanivorax sp. 1008]